MSYRFEDYETGELPWLDRPDAGEAVTAKLAAGEIDAPMAERLDHWIQDGYVILGGLLEQRISTEINAEIEALLQIYSHEPVLERQKRLNNAFPHSAGTREALVLPELLRFLDLLMGKRMIPHQTLNLPISSQQGPHSDQILMSTQPAGHMAAVWFALEDIDEECGPLFFFPGSHRWPYISAEKVGIPRGAEPAQCDVVYNKNYYPLVAKSVAAGGIEAREFIPKRGDLLVWHSNLIHGARLIERTGATRKSLIAHYYAEGVEHYTDLYGHAVSSRELRP